MQRPGFSFREIDGAGVETELQDVAVCAEQTQSATAQVRHQGHQRGPGWWPTPRSPDVPKLLLLASSWWLSAVLVTLQIKSMVHPGGLFPYTFALTSLTNGCTGILAAVIGNTVMRLNPPLPPMQWDEVAKLAAIGCIQGVEIGCNNKSLEYLSVSARTMAGSSSVLFMMLTARFWGLESLGLMRMAAALLITVGGALQGVDFGEFAEASETTNYISGMMLLFAAMCASSQRWALVQHVTQRPPPGSALSMMAKSKLHLVQFTLPCTAIVCLALSYQFEHGALALGHLLDWALMAKVVAIAVGITVLTVAELEIVRLTSAVALLVLGTMHQIPVAVAGVLFLDEQVRALSMVGFGFCILGGFCYVRARIVEIQQKNAHAPPPSLMTLEEPPQMQQMSNALVDESEGPL